MSGREEMIRQMESALRWPLPHEPGNPAQRWYADRNGDEFRAAAWCDMLVTWAAYKSGNYDAVCFGKDFAYTVWHAQEASRKGRWHYGTNGIKRGDIVFIQWEGGLRTTGKIDHVGIVTEVHSTYIETVEGNTANRCARRTRRRDMTICGFINPAYEEDELSAKDVWEYPVDTTGDGEYWQAKTVLGHLEKSQDRMEKLIDEMGETVAAIKRGNDELLAAVRSLIEKVE